MAAVCRKADWPILVAVFTALLLVPLALYVGGYFGLSESRAVLIAKPLSPDWESVDHVKAVIRLYDSQ
jgi:hypothetical protein